MQIENSVPIVPFYRDKKDLELNKLQKFLVSIKDEFDLRDPLKEKFLLTKVIVNGAKTSDQALRVIFGV